MPNNSMTEIADDARNVMSDTANGDNISSMAKPAARKAREGVSQMRQSGSDAVDTAANMADSAIGASERAARAVDQYITTNPFKSVMIAFAAGMFIRRVV